jgi:MEMO1 family protein
MASGREPAVAGSFYPNNPDELKTELSTYFARTKNTIHATSIKAILVPHAGTVFSGQTAAWGYRQLNQTARPHFILIGPSHHISFDGIGASSADLWQTPLGGVAQIPPKTFTRDVILLDEAHEQEHCLEIQLPFLQQLFPVFSFTAFVTGIHVDIEAVSIYLVDQFPLSVFIISSDLSHYLPDNQARNRDNKTIDAIRSGDLNYILQEDNVACGHWAIALAMELANLYHWQRKLIQYDTSASAFGDRSQVVGYSSFAWYEK